MEITSFFAAAAALLMLLSAGLSLAWFGGCCNARSELPGTKPRGLGYI